MWEGEGRGGGPKLGAQEFTDPGVLKIRRTLTGLSLCLHNVSDPKLQPSVPYIPGFRRLFSWLINVAEFFPLPSLLQFPVHLFPLSSVYQI